MATITNVETPDVELLDFQALSLKVCRGLEFLNNACNEKSGFQNTCIGESRSDLVEKDHPEEIFSSLMALDLLSTCLSKETLKTLYRFVSPTHLYTAVNFNKYEELIPDDVEDTSLAHYVLYRDGFIQKNDPILHACRLIILNTNKDGVIQLYFPPRGFRDNRFDPSCISNAMRILYGAGYDREARITEDYLFKWLEEGQHLKEVRYYPSPDTFLYFLSRAVSLSSRAKERFADLIFENLKNRVGSTKYPMDLAMRILTFHNLGLLGRPDVVTLIEPEVTLLLSLQEESGSFPKDALFKKGRSNTFYGGTVISTIFGVAAARAYLLSSVVDFHTK